METNGEYEKGCAKKKKRVIGGIVRIISRGFPFPTAIDEFNEEGDNVGKSSEADQNEFVYHGLTHRVHMQYIIR